MPTEFFKSPILNSPYVYPCRYWELDSEGQPTQRIIEDRREADFITPIPKAKKRNGKAEQQEMVMDEGEGLSTDQQQYTKTNVNSLRKRVDEWRRLPDPADWKVTPETKRLLQHWRHFDYPGIRPFFCQVEAIETLIWLTEVAPKSGKVGKGFLEHLDNASISANPELLRIALKLATGAGKTTVMAMIIAWQTINAVRRPSSKHFTRGFLLVAPGITIRDRLRVLLPNDTESYYKHRQLIPSDMLDEINKAKIVITNYHLFGQLKRISKLWLNEYLVCKGGTYPAQLSYKVIADMACEKIHAAITRAGMQSEGERIVKALLDPYNPEGSTTHVNFRTSKEDLYQTAVEQCHVNWVVLDSDWEAEFCRVAEAHPNVLAYVKNHNLGLDVPYRFLSESRKYIPDFIVLVDDGHGPDDPLHLIVEIKGYRQEDAKIKKETMDTYWIPGVNNHGTFGRWAFAEFTDVYEMQDDFEQEVTGKFESMLAACTQATTADPLCENAPNKPQNT